MSFFASRPQLLTGVDMGATHVRVLMLRQQRSRCKVVYYGCALLPPLPDHHDAHPVAVMIRAIMATLPRGRSRRRSRRVAAAVATAAVITKRVDMPLGLSADDLENQMEIEAERHIPYPMDEVSIDFDVLAPTTSTASSQRLLLVAARTETVAQCADTLTQAGLRAAVIDVEALAVQRALTLLTPQLPVSPDAVIAVFDVGEYGSKLMVFERQHMLYARSHDVGGHQLRAMIADAYELSAAAVRTLDVSDPSLDAYAERVLMPFQQALAQSLQHLLQFFHANGDDRSIDQLIITGDYARSSGLNEWVPSVLNIPCCIADPLQALELTGQTMMDQALRRHAPCLMTALGLALRRAP